MSHHDLPAGYDHWLTTDREAEERERREIEAERLGIEPDQIDEYLRKQKMEAWKDVEI
jgi:hypothetical protein